MSKLIAFLENVIPDLLRSILWNQILASINTNSRRGFRQRPGYGTCRALHGVVGYTSGNIGPMAGFFYFP